MKTADVMGHFKSVYAISMVLNVTRDSVYKWGDDVPLARQYELEVKTGGVLKSTYTKNREKMRAVK